MLFWTLYAMLWLMSALITAGALAFAGLRPDNAFADELAAFITAPDVSTWLRGRAARARRRAARAHSGKPGTPPR